MQTLEWRRDGPANKSPIFPRLAPSSARPCAKTRRRISTFCHLGVKSVRGESLRALFGRICAGRLLFAGFRRNKDQERRSRIDFLCRKPQKETYLILKNVFHGISYEFYCSVFFIFQCHSNVFVDLKCQFSK